MGWDGMGWDGIAWAMVRAFVYHQAAMHYTPKVPLLKTTNPSTALSHGV